MSATFSEFSIMLHFAILFLHSPAISKDKEKDKSVACTKNCHTARKLSGHFNTYFLFKNVPLEDSIPKEPD